MRNLLQILGLEKKKPERSLFKQTTLRDNDLVLAYPILIPPYLRTLFLIRDNCLCSIKEDPLEIDTSNPIVFFRYLGEPEKEFLKKFQPYGEIKESLKEASLKESLKKSGLIIL